MDVSRQQAASADDAAQAPAVEKGPRARTRRLMLETATRLMQSGLTPSVSEVAEAAEVSRATAYRYFPSQAALVQAVVDEGLGPILTWKSASDDAERRDGQDGGNQADDHGSIHEGRPSAQLIDIHAPQLVRAHFNDGDRHLALPVHVWSKGQGISLPPCNANS